MDALEYKINVLRSRWRFEMKNKIRIMPITITAVVFILAGLCFLNFNFLNSYHGINDLQYKKNIITESNNSSYKLENMETIAGPEEIFNFIKKNDNSPEIYVPSKNNIEQHIFKANLHMHTVNSDGSLTVKELIDSANQYAQGMPKGYFYVAITDHNTVNGVKQAVDIIQKNPEKYKKLRIILGMEVFSVKPKDDKLLKAPIDIHILCWAINPYDKNLNKIFKKINPKDKYNYFYRTFEDGILLMQNYGIVGIAHPARYIDKNNIKSTKEIYINGLFDEYKNLNRGNVLFSEGYYQSYKKNIDKNFINYINIQCKRRHILRTGSLDTHGKYIFSN